MTFALDTYLTTKDAWYLAYPTTDMAYAEAQHLLSSCPDVEAVLIWPASDRKVDTPDKWAVLFAGDLISPNYYVLTREGYDPLLRLCGNCCVQCGAEITTGTRCSDCGGMA